jgi:5'-nucleotidase
MTAGKPTALCILWTMALLLLSISVFAQQASAPAHIVVANDDGVDSPGIAALVDVLAADPGYRVTVVAPADKQSGQGHALVISSEIRAWRHDSIAGCPTWAVDATPATVVGVALSALLADDPPQLVVSGINRGENSGRTAWYSGTIGAAREAVLEGVPAVAISLQLNWSNPEPDFEGAARWAKPVIDAVRDHGLPAGVLLNVNVPLEVSAIRGYRIARMGLARDEINGYEVVREEDGALFLRGKWSPPTEDAPGTDTEALLAGWVSLVPLHLDQTALSALPALDALGLHSTEATGLTTGANLLLWVFPLVLVVLVVALAVVQRRAGSEER